MKKFLTPSWGHNGAFKTHLTLQEDPTAFDSFTTHPSVLQQLNLNKMQIMENGNSVKPPKIQKFPKSLHAVTFMFVPPPAQPRKSLFDEMMDVELSSVINKKLRKRKKSSSNLISSFNQQNDEMGALLKRSLTVEEDLKVIRSTLKEVEQSQKFVGGKVEELRGRIDCLCNLTEKIESNMGTQTKDLASRQRVLQERCYELLLELNGEWTVDGVECHGESEEGGLLSE